MQDSELKKIVKLLSEAEERIEQAKDLLVGKEITISLESPKSDQDSKSIEGVFNGLVMLDANGGEYPVPQNYASKSKLVTGDLLKLTIKDDGSFLFKQIGPVERKHEIAELKIKKDQYIAETEVGDRYQILLASVTYFKAKAGDKVTIVLPSNGPAKYAALENVIKPL